MQPTAHLLDTFGTPTPEGVRVVTKRVEDARPALLAVLQQQGCVGPHAKAQSIKVRRFDAQGKNRVTVQIEADGHDYILSVDMDTPSVIESTPYVDQQAFKEAARAQGVPVPRTIARFTLPTHRWPCELTEFCHGSLRLSLERLTPKEMQSIAQTLAKLHAAGDRFKAKHTCRPWHLRQPPNVGFRHNDFKLANLIFKGETVAGVVDFEFAHYRPRLNDLCQLVQFSMREQSTHRHGAWWMELSPAALDMIRHYHAERPLEPREVGEMALRLTRLGLQKYQFPSRTLSDSANRLYGVLLETLGMPPAEKPLRDRGKDLHLLR